MRRQRTTWGSPMTGWAARAKLSSHLSPRDCYRSFMPPPVCGSPNWRLGNASFNSREMTFGKAVRSAPDDLRSGEELAAVEFALDHKEEARALAKQWLTRYPTSYFLREELGQPDNDHLGAHVDRVLNTASEYMRLGLYEREPLMFFFKITRRVQPRPARTPQPRARTPNL